MARPSSPGRPHRRRPGVHVVTDPLDTVTELARQLPHAAAVDLSRAAADGPSSIQRLRAGAGTPTLRAACDRITALIEHGAHPQYIAGALAAASNAELHQRTSSIEVVW